MKVTTEEFESCEVLLTIEFEPDQEQDMLKKAAKRIAREVNIPGFRRGKAPFNTVVRRFGLEVVQQEALEQSSEKLLTEALDEAEIEPYAQIQLEEINWNPLVIKVKVPTKPKVKLGNYRDNRLEVEPVEVTDEDVDESLLGLQEQFATWSPVERPSEVGDLLSMSIVGKDGDDEVVVEDEAAELELYDPEEMDGQQLDLTTPLLGLSAGEEKTFTVTYPEDFDNDQLAGKEITFTVEVSGVKVKEFDPLDDDFAQQVSEVDTLEELKENIRENIKQRRERQRDMELGEKMLEKVIEGAETLEWPLALEEENIDDEIERYEQAAREAGMNLSSYLQLQNKTEEALREETRGDVIDRLKNGLVLGKVAELEKIEVSESEILEQAKLISDVTGGGEKLWQSILGSQSQQNLIANDIRSTKAIRRLAAIAKGEAPEPGEPDAAADEAEPATEESGGDEAPVISNEVTEASPDLPQTAVANDEAESNPTEAPADDESASEPVKSEA